MSIWFSSDTHFCHDRGFIYEPRGVSSVDEMNALIIKNWNSVVKPTDTVYLLGDIMLNDNEKGIQLLSQLNGQIHLFGGNHDSPARIAAYKKCPNVVQYHGIAEIVHIDGYKLYLSHHPTFTSNLENDAPIKAHLINLFGHTHQHTNFYQDIPFMYHVGLDSHDCFPVSFETVINDIKAEVARCKAML